MVTVALLALSLKFPPEVRFMVAFSFFSVAPSVKACRTTVVEEAPAGSKWAIGTELHLVSRLARNLAPERTVVTLDSLPLDRPVALGGGRSGASPQAWCPRPERARRAATWAV